jgi:hypothetical protein
MGDDGHHFITLTGPGRIWLQSMPLPILAGALSHYLGGDDHHPVEAGATAGASAKVLGDLFR